MKKGRTPLALKRRDYRQLIAETLSNVDGQSADVRLPFSFSEVRCAKMKE
jgi:hypothetical protein